MKVKKLIKKTFKDEYVSITYKHKDVYVGLAGELKDEKILNRKIKYAYADRISINDKSELCLAIGLKKEKHN